MKRYEAYKDSGVEWIGEIPEGWRTTPLKALFSFGKGLPITKADLLEEGEPVISYGQIHSKANTPAHVKQELVRYVSPGYLTRNIASLTLKGDFIFADTSEDVEGSGNYVFHDIEGRIFAGYHTLILRPSDKSHGRFLSYLFQADQWKSQIRSRVSGVKLFSLTLRILTKASLLLPPSQEQQAIVDYLDAKTAEIDGLVADCEREVELLREYRKSLISEAVTKGLDPDAPMKDSGIEWIGEIPASWETNKLRYCGTTQNGISKGGEYFGAGYPFVSYGNAYRNELDKPELFGLIESTENERERYGIRRGDVLFTRTSETIEEVGISAGALCDIEDCCFAGFLIRFRPSENWGVLPEYAAYYFRSDLYRPYLTKEMVLVTRASMSQQLLGGITVLFPPINEQEDIVGYLDTKTAEIDSLIEAKQSMADKLREYHKSLISEAVTGKFKVPGI